MRVEQAMHAGELAPIVTTSARMPDVFHEMSSKRLGMTCVVDEAGKLAGVFTDGDLRRLMMRTADVLGLTAAEVMTRQPITHRSAAVGGGSAEDDGSTQDYVRRRRRRGGFRRGCRAPARSLADTAGLMATRENMTVEERARRIRLLLFDVDGVLTDGARPHARRRQRIQGLPHQGRGRDCLGPARRSARGPVVLAIVRGHGAPRGPARRAHRPAGRGEQIHGVRPDSERCQRDRGRRLGHGRRPARSARVDALRPVRGAGRRCRGGANQRGLGEHGCGRTRRRARVDRNRAARAGARWAAVVAEHGGQH